MKRERKNIIYGFLAGILILFTFLMIFTDPGKWFSKEKVITVGVFSDSYWNVQNGYSYRILEEAIQVFEKEHPQIKVEYVTGILKGDYSEWLAKQILSESAPDVFWILSEDFNDLAEVGALEDLTEFIRNDPLFDENAFYTSAYECGQYHGTQYALPYECAPKLMFVNKSILDREQIPLPDDSWTWEELFEICKDVTKDLDGNGTPDQFGIAGYGWKEAFEANGVRLFNEEGTECFLATSEVEESLYFLEKLSKLNGDAEVSGKQFDLGKAAFLPMSFSQYRAYKPYPLSVKKYANFEWDCILMPSGPSGENISSLETLMLAMNANTKEKKEAWEFIKVLTCDPEIQAKIFDFSEGVAVLKEVTESDDTLWQLIEKAGSNTGMNLQVLSEAVENAAVAQRFRNYDAATAEIDKAITSILNGNSNISMDLIVWNRTINQYLENLD